jgi:protein-disulfide isomerase
MGEPRSKWIWLDRAASVALIVGVAALIISVLNRAQEPSAPPVRTPADVQDIDPIVVADKDTSRGAQSAHLVLIEFSDFQCPFCGRHARETYNQLASNYVDTGKLLYIFKSLPLDVLHPHAFKASEAAECARSGNRFWEMHDRLFENQDKLGEPNLADHARAVGLDVDSFSECMKGEMTAVVKKDASEAARLGVFATPTFFLATKQRDGQLVAFRRINGAQPYSVFVKAIEQGLHDSK